MSNDTNKPNFSVKIPDDLKKKFKVACAEKEQSMTDVIVNFIKSYLK